jgi:hypothetical protein
MRLAIAIACMGCGTRAAVPPARPITAGISIASYAQDGGGYSIIDDRRWVDVTGDTLLLANIEPGAALASLVIEPTTSAVRIGQCGREPLPDSEQTEPLDVGEYRMRIGRRIPSMRPAIETTLPALPAGERYAPIVRCAVRGAPGRYLVRIVYVSPRLRYRAQHDVTVSEPAKASIASRFAFATPAWRARAELVLYDGIPGGERPPREVARGEVTLDGSTAVLQVPEREAPAELRYVFDGAIVSGEDEQDVMWGQESATTIWVWLELAKLRLAPGPVHVHLELPDEDVRDVDVDATSRKQDDAPDATLRLPLWVDPELHGSRQRVVAYNDGNWLVEHVMLGVGNMSESPRTVFIEEPLREAATRRLERAWPTKPTAAGDRLRQRVEVKPGRVERVRYTISYKF